MIREKTMNTKSIIILLWLIFLFISCQEPTEPDTTPPTVTITYPQSGSTVSEVVSITCMSTDNEGVKKVELWVDGISTGISDESEPYSLEWNTSHHEDGPHNITLRAYDKNGNKTDSSPITLNVDNSNSYPTRIELKPITYKNGVFNITWAKTFDADFYKYTLYESQFEDMINETEIFESYNNNDTTFSVTGIGENESRYYQLAVSDSIGLVTLSSISYASSYSLYPKIIYHTLKNSERLTIYSLNNDGSNRTELTEAIDGRFPECSIDGRYIVFESYSSVYRMNYDGSNQVKLSNHGSYPKISNDNSKIIFYSYQDHNAGEIYTMNIDGTNQIRLSYEESYNGEYEFSPDCEKIVYLSRIDNNDEIYIMNSDGSNQTRLTYTDDGYCREPSFSPNGSEIVYRYVKGGNSFIYKMNNDGSNQNSLNCYGDHPQFSSDGEKILFMSERDGDSEIYIMNSDGTGQTNLTNNAGGDWYPQFSPDCSQIVFYSTRDGKDEVYITNADGTEQKRLTTEGGEHPQFLSKSISL